MITADPRGFTHRTRTYQLLLVPLLGPTLLPFISSISTPLTPTITAHLDAWNPKLASYINHTDIPQTSNVEVQRAVISSVHEKSSS